MKNTFVTFLDVLGVKHTRSFSDQYFNEQPDFTSVGFYC